jgi:hypothetical protein
MFEARMARARWRWSFAMALAVAGFGVGAAAQDTATTTPPELKDFRLDAPPAKQPVAPRPPVEAPNPQTDIVAPRPETKAPDRPATVAPVAARRAEKADAKVEGKAAQPSSATEQPAIIAEPTTPPPTPETINPETAETNAPVLSPLLSTLARYWWLIVGLFSALAGLAAYLIWRKRRTETPDLAEQNETARRATPVEPANDTHAGEAAFAVTPELTHVKTGSGKFLHASFDPAEARLSIANLSVTGCLRLRHNGPDILPTLRLRSQVISACDGQQRMINDFHANSSAGQIDNLGPVQPGEEIVLTLELQVPRDGLQAFDWRERRFIAPIVLINVSGEETDIAPCRINCLVGQEGDPASAKMRPLPIDRGPRRFGDLRFQPLAA